MSFLDLLKGRVLLGDGANNTALKERGYEAAVCELAVIENADLVQQIHQSYCEAGADFIITNTFMANKFRMPNLSPEDLHQLNYQAAKLARSSVTKDQAVFGSIGPCGKPVEPIGHIKLSDCYNSVQSNTRALVEGGVDAILLETYVSFGELKTAIEAVQSVTNLPIIASKAYIEDGEALNEGLPTKMTQSLEALGVAAVGANCIVGPQRMLDIVRQMREATRLPILAMPTAGVPMLVKGQVVYNTSPEYFSKSVLRLAEEGAQMIGGCCGTSIEHIRQTRMLLDQKPIKVHHRASKAQVKDQTPLEPSEPTELAQKLGKKFIVTVEMDLPRGLKVEKVLQGARSLKIKGADLIDISDGARARLRMNPLAVSTLIQNQVGIEVMMHFSCRDRNLLAIQADLLGAHALGVRNILAITGDPAQIGDYPSATSVFDVDAIGLTRILSRFNEGIDLAGYSIGVQCAFTIAVAFNPLAKDIPAEMEKLQKKKDAGAHLIYTQPLFEQKAVDQALEMAHKIGLPIFVGVLPLRSSRHAEFMHNEVPGISVPEWLRAQIKNAPDEASALTIGIEEAQRLSCYLKPNAQGLYLMPPFGNHQIAEEVINAVF